MKPPSLIISTSPFLKHKQDTAWIMWQVNLALLPIVLVAVYLFGVSALLVIAACTAGAVVPEWLINRAKKNTVADGSALITGVLLALTLPPAVPLWIAFTGGAVAILLGKLMFGGIGYTIFNPALVGRAFLQAAFPVHMTTWSPRGDASTFFAVNGDPFAPPFMRARVDAVSEATPLASMKFDAQPTEMWELLSGATSGSLGETSAILILLCGAYLALRRVLNWRIPAGIFATVVGLAALLHFIDPVTYAGPGFHLLSGGLILGAVFMATDPVTSPITQRGAWVFAIGIGVLVVVIRSFGGLPEGVMYAILFMNALVPLINRFTQPRVFGTPAPARYKP
jgi:Na+-translocating ferredoxin:NAD+ oxidoreductase subunit D